MTKVALRRDATATALQICNHYSSLITSIIGYAKTMSKRKDKRSYLITSRVINYVLDS